MDMSMFAGLKDTGPKDVHFNCPGLLAKKLQILAVIKETTLTALIVTALENYLEEIENQEQ
ncbi:MULTISPECIES: hypothetical protein [Actinotignum]|uniref:hypothetical protein n=1 Tax=Actinotignum TaxID=1653174 RepID=UPI000B3608A0|nr:MULTISPECIES: hypothetical protein [Actinotignum]MDY5127765.1 hypothetical protein [Actinotignum sp. SLA_B059]MDY5157649.1 hypothetical protein [Actinotignum timonense]